MNLILVSALNWWVGLFFSYRPALHNRIMMPTYLELLIVHIRLAHLEISSSHPLVDVKFRAIKIVMVILRVIAQTITEKIEKQRVSLSLIRCRKSSYTSVVHSLHSLSRAGVLLQRI
jgi:hypothetical protein